MSKMQVSFVVALALRPLACTPEPGAVGHECVLSGNYDWQQRIESQMDNPPCPQAVNFPGQQKYFAGNFEAGKVYVIPSSSGTYALSFKILDANGQLTMQEVLYPQWQPKPLNSTRATAAVSGWYDAGNAATLENPRTEDSIDVYTVVWYGSPPNQTGYAAVGGVRVGTTRSVQTSIAGPGTAQAYTWVTMDASAANYSSPLSYAWTVNGSPACGNSATCGATLGGGGSSTSFQVTITDADGDVGTASHVVAALWEECPECMRVRGIGPKAAVVDSSAAGLRHSRAVEDQPVSKGVPRSRRP